MDPNTVQEELTAFIVPEHKKQRQKLSYECQDYSFKWYIRRNKYKTKIN